MNNKMKKISLTKLSEKRMKRRRFLQVGACAIGLGAIVSGAWYVLGRESEANQYLENFPLKIPGASEVRKYKSPRAQHCLVHILQTHRIDDELIRKAFPEFTDEQLKAAINFAKQYDDNTIKVQRDIYTILSYLIDNKSLSSVYNESLISEHALLLQREIDELRNNVAHLDSLRDKWKHDNREIQENIQKAYDLYYSLLDRLGLDSSVWRLQAEGRLKVKYAETIEANKSAINSLHLNNDIGILMINDKREDTLLQIIAGNKDRFAVTVYGAGHAWGGKQSCGDSYILEERRSVKDNIYEWNIKNPDKKFSLIEIVPQSYKLENK